MTTDDDLLRALQERIVLPGRRIDLDTVDVPPLYGVATGVAVAEAERSLGFPLADLLRRIYLEVGNGGFGPSAGILGLRGGYSDIDGRNAVDLYQLLMNGGWPEGLVPLLDWGGGAWAATDASGQVITLSEDGPMVTGFAIGSWFEAWLAGVDLATRTFEFSDDSMLNPFSRRKVPMKVRGPAKGKRLLSN